MRVGLALLAVLAIGCAQSRARVADHAAGAPPASAPTPDRGGIAGAEAPPSVVEGITLVSAESSVAAVALPEPSRLPTPGESADAGVAAASVPEEVFPSGPVTLDQVVGSVRQNFPLIESAIASRTVASGQALASVGAFDHKLEAYSNNQPLDFYKNYWHGAGIKRDTFWGGQVYGGYRVGRGVYEPWYLERETNDGGEFNAGFVAPLAQNRWSDENRAEYWRAQLEQRRVEPEILAQVIGSVRDGSVAYWDWVAAGAQERVAEGLVRLAQQRNELIERQIATGEKAPIDRVDNRRLIVSREAKAIDARRKVQQSAAKLSLFLRRPDGTPIVLEEESLPEDFPAITPLDPGIAGRDVDMAIANRPELAELALVRRQLQVAYNQAQNLTLPQLNGGLQVSQDMGAPTSAKRDKSQLQLDATLLLNVPLERRKAYGKVRELRGKFAQLRAKTRFAADKIGVEVQAARAALLAAIQRVDRTTESLALARRLQDAEGRLYGLGQSTLFNLNLREQQAAEAASDRIGAYLEYYGARADYLAALGVDDPRRVEIDALSAEAIRADELPLEAEEAALPDERGEDAASPGGVSTAEGG